MILNRAFTCLVLASALLSSTTLTAQSPKSEKRIYLVDLTGSMEGRGNVPTPNILQTVKDNLVQTISSIEDVNTEVQIIPFTNRVGDSISGSISDRESILEAVRSLHTLSGDTNIADAWSYGIAQLDSTKINYLFLLTDGLHNNGPTKDVLFERLRDWGRIARDRYNYAFYVMLTPNAKENEICEIVESTDKMWLIESMDINASLVRTSLSTRKNVFNSHTASLSFFSNNRNANLENLGLEITLEENGFYSIDNVSKSPLGDIYTFNIVEKRPKMQMPLDTTLKLYFSYDTLANPFVFLTPDKVDFQIVNQGPRTLSVSIENNKKGLSDLNLKKLKYKEPFQGFFRWTRELFEPYFDLPFLSKPDTASVTTRFILSWNEEAIRAGSSLLLYLDAYGNEYADHIVVSNGSGNSPVFAKSVQDTLALKTTVTPGIPSARFNGEIIAFTDKVDSVNNEEISENDTAIGSWRLQYKKSWPFWIWLFWIVIIVMVNAALFFIVKEIIVLFRKLISILFGGVKTIGRGSHYSTTIPGDGVVAKGKKCEKQGHSSKVSLGGWKASVQKKTRWSDAIINALRSEEEAKIYIKANLKEATIGGRPALVRDDIDWSDYPCRRNEWLKEKLADYDSWVDYNNADLIGEGFPPRDYNGNPIELHHIGQRQDSPFAELRWEEHMGDGNNKILHEMGKESEIDRSLFDKEKADYWRSRFNAFSQEDLAKIYD